MHYIPYYSKLEEVKSEEEKIHLPYCVYIETPQVHVLKHKYVCTHGCQTCDEVSTAVRNQQVKYWWT